MSLTVNIAICTTMMYPGLLTLIVILTGTEYSLGERIIGQKLKACSGYQDLSGLNFTVTKERTKFHCSTK